MKVGRHLCALVALNEEIKTVFPFLLLPVSIMRYNVNRVQVSLLQIFILGGRVFFIYFVLLII
jgi:hypothetical protein